MHVVLDEPLHKGSQQLTHRHYLFQSEKKIVTFILKMYLIKCRNSAEAVNAILKPIRAIIVRVQHDVLYLVPKHLTSS